MCNFFSVFAVRLRGDNEEQSACPDITLPVIIPAINVQLFGTNQIPLNVCDAILTIDSANGNKTIHGSASNDCSNILVCEAHTT